MTRRIRALAGAALLALAGLAAAPAVLAGDPCYHGYSIPPVTTETGILVRMEPCAFVPTNVRVAPGWTVTFKNPSEDVHLLMGANGVFGERDREIKPGEAVEVTFDEPGVYPFSCALHRGMSGAVIVDQAAESGTALAPASVSTSTSTDQWLALAVAGLAVIAVVGWGAAFAQRRRVSP